MKYPLTNTYIGIILSGVKQIHLRTAREKKEWTQEQLEAVSGIAQAIISKLERESDAKAMFDTVVKLADALEVDPRALKFGPDPKRQERISA